MKHAQLPYHAACTAEEYALLVVALVFSPSWRELSGSEHQQAAKASQERNASTVGVIQGAMARASGVSAYGNGWERYGARYFKGVLKMKEAGGKDRNVELQVEVSLYHTSYRS